MESEKYDKLVRIGLFLLLFAAFGFALRGGARQVTSTRVVTENEEKEKPCVVIDAGHGSGNLRKVAKGK